MNRGVLTAAAAIAVAAATATVVIVVGLNREPAALPPPAPSAVRASVSPSPAPAPTLTPRSSGPGPTSAPAASRPSSSASRPARLRAAVPVLPAARQSDPLAVAETVIAALYSVDPVVDSDPSDAARRGAYLLTPSLAGQLTATPRTGSGAQWRQWEATGAYVTVTVTRIQIPWLVADSRLSAVRAVGYVQAVHTAAGTTALTQRTLALTLVRARDTDPWRVASMETP